MDSLPAIFRRALASLSKASNLPTMEDATQELTDSALKDLRNARIRISDLGLFSPNETLEDISTRDLVYLLVPFVLAEAENRARATERADRLAHLRDAEINYNAFLRNLEQYEIVPESERSLYGQAASVITDASRRRETRLKQYKAEKEIRNKIEALRRRRHASTSFNSSLTDFDLVASLLPPPTSTAADPSADEDSNTDEILRDATLLLLRLFYAQTQGQLNHLSQELELLRNAPPPSRPTGDETGQKTGEIDWKLDAPRRRDGPLLDPKGKPLQPFTILPSGAADRARLQSQVFQADHRLPTMTIDEYLEIEQQRGNIITGGGAASAAQPTSKEQLALDAEQDGTAFGGEKADEKRQQDENWARYTDANPRGSGNTMNRG